MLIFIKTSIQKFNYKQNDLLFLRNNSSIRRIPITADMYRFIHSFDNIKVI